MRRVYHTQDSVSHTGQCITHRTVYHTQGGVSHAGECVTHRGVYHTQDSVSHTGRCIVRVHQALVGAWRATALVGDMRTYVHSYILTLTLTLTLTLDLTLTCVVIRGGGLHTCAYSTGGLVGVHTYITGEVHAYVHIGGVHTALVACIHDCGVHTY